MSIADTIARLCYAVKQPIASFRHDSAGMAKTAVKSISQVIAGNLAYYMKERGMNQPALAAASGVAQTTISLYLDPDRRLPSKSGKAPSPKVTELAQLAIALGIEAWQLMRDQTPEEREFYGRIEEAYIGLRGAK
jgi:transcriptional regulator with XRE-family HTH domain